MESFTQRQQDIIDTAVKIIDRKGIQGLTIKNLSSEIGVTEGAIYRHFESKRDILASILAVFKAEIEDYAQTSGSSGEGTLKELSVVLHHFRRIFEKNPAIVSVIFAEEIFQNDQHLSEKVGQIIQTNQEQLLAIIRKGKASGELRGDLNDQMMVNSIMGPFRLMVKKWKMGLFAISLETSVNEFLDYLKATIFKDYQHPISGS